MARGCWEGKGGIGGGAEPRILEADWLAGRGGGGGGKGGGAGALELRKTGVRDGECVTLSEKPELELRDRNTGKNVTMQILLKLSFLLIWSEM